MSLSILNVIGIHPDDIEHAFEICQDTLKKVFLSSRTDDVEDKVSEILSETSFSWDDITNTIISSLFMATQEIIKDEYPDLETDFYVNGYDSHFYIHDNFFDNLTSIGVEPDIIKQIIKSNLSESLNEDKILELAKDKNTIKDFLAAFENNNFVLYDSVEELGEDNSDNGCREEDDTDETFGLFLIQAYKDGNSNTLYHLFENGEIIAIPLE